MQMVDLDVCDIRLDENGQPMIDSDGKVEIIDGEKCWLQDLRNEILTEQAELFYETEDEADSYGFGLTEFKNETYSDFLELEYQQRIREKLQKRKEIDPESITVKLTENDGVVIVKVHFQRIDSNEEYDAEISENRVEVVKE